MRNGNPWQYVMSSLEEREVRHITAPRLADVYSR